MRFFDILGDAVYLFIVIIVLSSIILFFVLFAGFSSSVGVNISLSMVKYASIVLFSVLMIAFSLAVILEYVPEILKEGEEE